MKRFTVKEILEMRKTKGDLAEQCGINGTFDYALPENVFSKFLTFTQKFKGRVPEECTNYAFVISTCYYSYENSLFGKMVSSCKEVQALLDIFHMVRQCRGTDYGNGKTNINPKEKIRFACIPFIRLDYSTKEKFDPYWDTCPEDIEDSFDECPDYWVLSDRGYLCTTTDFRDVIIEESPYYTYAQFCSHYIPGACCLSYPLDLNGYDFPEIHKCYCFGHNFFTDGKAPYPVFCKRTNQLVIGE